MTADEDKHPHLRLAVENDQRSIDRGWARNDVGRELRELAANIIRVVRGAGKPDEISGQCVAVLKAVQTYRDAAGHWPASHEISEALSISRDYFTDVYNDAWEREDARDTIVRGALQVVASRLVGQNTQEQRGRSEMTDGLLRLERIRAERAQREAEIERARRASLRPKSKSKPRKKATTRKPKG